MYLVRLFGSTFAIPLRNFLQGVPASTQLIKVGTARALHTFNHVADKQWHQKKAMREIDFESLHDGIVMVDLFRWHPSLIKRGATALKLWSLELGNNVRDAEESLSRMITKPGMYTFIIFPI